MPHPLPPLLFSLVLLLSISLSPCLSLSLPLPTCLHTSNEFGNVLTQVEIESSTPCVLYDTVDADPLPSDTTYITIGQNTGTSCTKHRDGAALAVSKINALNDNRGFKVGYTGAHYVKFRLVSVIAGTDQTTDFETTFRNITTHLTTTDTYNVDMFVGSCSNYAGYEKDIVNAAGKIITAQVGPGVYYEDETGAPDASLTHVFGIHLSSYTYTYPSLLAAKYQGASTFAIAGRDASVFFQSTCAKAEDYALGLGLEQAIPRVEYASALKDDEEYQRQLARDLCNSQADIIIGCIGGGGKGNGYEADFWVDEWRKMGNCNPEAVWLTCTTWGWKTDDHDEAFMLGGGQWHPAMSYSDDFYSSGAEIYEDLESIYGYVPTCSPFSLTLSPSLTLASQVRPLVRLRGVVRHPVHVHEDHREDVPRHGRR